MHECASIRQPESLPRKSSATEPTRPLGAETKNILRTTVSLLFLLDIFLWRRWLLLYFWMCIKPWKSNSSITFTTCKSCKREKHFMFWRFPFFSIHSARAINFQDCSWIVRAKSPGRGVRIQFSTFNIESEEGCQYDYIEVSYAKKKWDRFAWSDVCLVLPPHYQKILLYNI